MNFERLQKHYWQHEAIRDFLACRPELSISYKYNTWSEVDEVPASFNPFTDEVSYSSTTTNHERIILTGFRIIVRDVVVSGALPTAPVLYEAEGEQGEYECTYDGEDDCRAAIVAALGNVNHELLGTDW